MKLKHWLSLILIFPVVFTLAAQNNSVAPANPPAATPAAPPDAAAPPVAPAPSAPAPDATTPPPAPAKPAAAGQTPPKAKKKKTKSAAAKTSAAKKAKSNPGHVVLDPPVSALVKRDAVNVRGQASFIGEVITHLKKGETVSILEEITLSKPQKDEPAKWAKISMPTNTPVWVSADFIDATNKTALKKINVRGGPGENFSVVARLAKGTVVKDLRKNNGWLEIETPTNAFGFVGAEFLEKQAPATPTAPVETAAPAPTPQVVNVAADPTAPVKAATDVPVVAAPAPVEPAPAPVVTAAAPPIPAPAPEPPKEEPLPKRVVTREGIVKKARNIQAPADFELHDTRTGELIDYLHAAKPEQNLKPYVGAKVIITGEEALDSRWKRTPLLEIETITMP